MIYLRLLADSSVPSTALELGANKEPPKVSGCTGGGFLFYRGLYAKN